MGILRLINSSVTSYIEKDWSAESYGKPFLDSVEDMSFMYSITAVPCPFEKR